MEHRWRQRRRVRLPVLLQLTKGDVVFGIAQNISRDGVYIRTPTKLELGCSVKVVMVRLPDETTCDQMPLPAIVVHRSDFGAGLMFTDLDIAAVAEIRRIQDLQASCEDVA